MCVPFLLATPETLATAARDLANISATVTVAPENEVSAAVATVFRADAQGYQAPSVRAAAFPDQFRCQRTHPDVAGTRANRQRARVACLQPGAGATADPADIDRDADHGGVSGPSEPIRHQ
ncbi:putative PE-PGRS family protein PE_PGRS24 [Mycobacterium simulans]|uniref:Putative PE-PGRS family protein PE_PGRS24 n=1 Tax=Mycobacterium simulans TaxID=627089 RepID=A0A7Z7IIK8_9MYCO|nr:putative PE-PGRS family protein PE_PGRS24 [Mycobacterium simulans]